MIFRIEVPGDGPQHLVGGQVTRWHHQEGDVISFGDDILDVAINQFMALRRTKRAALLARPTRRVKKLKNEYDLRDGRGEVNMRVTSSEATLHLRRILVAEGAAVSIGEPVAIVSTDPDEAVDESIALDNLPVLRVATNFIDDTDSEFD